MQNFDLRSGPPRFVVWGRPLKSLGFVPINRRPVLKFQAFLRLVPTIVPRIKVPKGAEKLWL
jgi:hypothetical protein